MGDGSGVEVPNAGSVTFRELPWGRGTEVKSTLEYLPPGGSVGESFAKFFGSDPQRLLQKAMFQFRQLMEAGEIAISSGQPVGENSRRHDRPGEEPRKTDSDVTELAQGKSDPHNRTVPQGKRS